jgi:hypothetical protein
MLQYSRFVITIIMNKLSVQLGKTYDSFISKWCLTCLLTCGTVDPYPANVEKMVSS